jgi:hypothetical protein
VSLHRQLFGMEGAENDHRTEKTSGTFSLSSDTFLYFGMCGRSKMREGLQRFLKLERDVLSIFRQREFEMPILFPAFRCDVEPAFCAEMLV